MPERDGIVRCAAVAAFIACVSLIALAINPRPSFGANHYAIFSGRQSLSPTELAAYLSYLRRNLTVDSVYLLGHIGMWVGFGVLIARRNKVGGQLIIALGVISGALDFLENEIRWAIVESLGAALPLGSRASESWALVWQVIVGMSFWAVFVTTLLTIIQVWSTDKRDRIISVIGLGFLPGVCLIYLKGYLITFLWMILWHGSAGVYLWQSGSERESRNQTQN